MPHTVDADSRLRHCTVATNGTIKACDSCQRRRDHLDVIRLSDNPDCRRFYDLRYRYRHPINHLQLHTLGH